MFYIIAYLAIVASLLGYVGLSWFGVCVGVVIASILLFISAGGSSSRNRDSSSYNFGDDD